jgi:hypothetical protein
MSLQERRSLRANRKNITSLYNCYHEETEEAREVLDSIDAYVRQKYVSIATRISALLAAKAKISGSEKRKQNRSFFSHQNEIKQSALINVDEILVPCLHDIIGCSDLPLFAQGLPPVVDMVLAVFYHLGENVAGHIGKRNRLIHASVLDHVPHGNQLASNSFLDLKHLVV